MVFVQHCHLAFGIFQDSDRGIAHGIRRAVYTDLVNGFEVLESQVLGQNAGGLAAQNPIQLIGGSQRGMIIDRAAGLSGKTLIVALHELRQPLVSLLGGGNASQAHFFGQAVLQGLIGPFHSPFGLGGIGADDLNAQLLHSPSEVGQSVPWGYFRVVEVENTMLIAVERSGFAISLKIVPGSLTVAKKALVWDKP